MRKSFGIFLCIVGISGISLDAAAHGFGAAGGRSGSGTTVVGSPSAHAMANSNGPFSLDRDSGLARAEDRMSQEGLKHEQASSATLKRHGASGSRHSSTSDSDTR